MPRTSGTPPLSATIRDACIWAQTQGLSRAEWQMLVLHALGRSTVDRAWLLAHDTDPMPSKDWAALQLFVQRRLQGEPVAYITGCKEFFGLPLHIDAGVLDPRDDTETLVDWALELLHAGPSLNQRVVDLGTGSGAVALAIKSQYPAAEVHAVDTSAEALVIAQANAMRLDLSIDFHHGSWLEPVSGSFDLIVSNPPYIAIEDPHLTALQHEPLLALVSGADGLDAIRAIVLQSRERLKPGGWLLMEHGHDQADAVHALLHRIGYRCVQSRKDLAGIDRCSGGQLVAMG